MGNELIEKKPNEIEQLEEISQQEVIVLSPEEEFLQGKKKRKTIRFSFGVFVFIQLLLCAIILFGINQNDLHNRVVNQLENNLSGQNTFRTGTYTGETDFGYLVGQGIFKFDSGSLYEGQFANNHFEGLGTLKIPSEGTYVGSFLKSEKSGNGIFTWEDGTVYDGEWKHDQMTGQGTYTTPNNVKYVGTFDYNCFKDGKCTFTNETGDYSVEYKDFNIDTLTVTFVDGSTYIGSCDGTNISGSGTMQFVNGDKYTGKFTDGVRDGQGVYEWKNGDQYDGAWSKDVMSGSGKYTFASGNVAQGTFKNNAFTDGSYTVSNSFGEYTFTVKDSDVVSVEMTLKSGTTYSGDMAEGKLTGSAQISYSNGDKYSGHVNNGYKSGQGSYTWSSGASYEGDWVDDKMEGQGTYFYPTNSTGYKLTGDFKKGVPEGECQYYVSSSESYKTDWTNGKCVKIYE